MATDFGSPCPQAETAFGPASLEEDCLFLTVYGYWFSEDDAPSPLSDAAAAGGFDLGAAHSLEIQYIFDTLLNREPTDAQLALSEAIIDYWASFAKYGQPVSDAGVGTAWPSYTASGELLELDVDPLGTRPEADFAGYHDCSYWAAPPTAPR